MSALLTVLWIRKSFGPINYQIYIQINLLKSLDMYLICCYEVRTNISAKENSPYTNNKLGMSDLPLELQKWAHKMGYGLEISVEAGGNKELSIKAAESYVCIFTLYSLIMIFSRFT